MAGKGTMHTVSSFRRYNHCQYHAEAEKVNELKQQQLKLQGTPLSLLSGPLPALPPTYAYRSAADQARESFAACTSLTQEVDILRKENARLTKENEALLCQQVTTLRCLLPTRLLWLSLPDTFLHYGLIASRYRNFPRRKRRNTKRRFCGSFPSLRCVLSLSLSLLRHKSLEC